MASVFQQQVTQANNTKRSAEGARAEAQQARAGISTPNADNLIAQGDVYLTAGDDLLARGHPADAITAYAAANAHFNDATADAERERAALAASAAAAAAAQQAAAAAAQQAAIAQQRQQAAIAQAAAATAAQQAQAAAKVQAALNAKAAAAAANTAALKTIAAQPSKPSPAPVPAGRPVAQPVSSHPSPPPAKHPAPARPPKHNPAKQAPPSRTAGGTHQGAVFTAAYSSVQLAQQEAMFTAWQQSGANRTVLRCLFLIGVAENEWDPYTCNSSDHCGVFQLDSDWQREHSYEDTGWWASYAIRNGFYSYGGLRAIVASHPSWSIGEMVEACQGAGPTFSEAAAYYNGRLGEADAALAAIERSHGTTPAPPKGRPKYGAPPGAGVPQPAPVASGAWNGNPAGQQLEAAFHQLHTTLKTWNPGFRHQLSLRARQPIGG